MRTRRHALVLLAGFGLAGCGFQLRRPAELPFARLGLSGFASGSTLEAEFRRTLADSVIIPDQASTADVVLQALADVRGRTVVASTAVGQVREIQLSLTFSARADTPAGRALMAPVTLRLTRDLSYSETAALAKEDEEAQLFLEMQSDVVAQILRRLATIRL